MDDKKRQFVRMSQGAKLARVFWTIRLTCGNYVRFIHTARKAGANYAGMIHAAWMRGGDRVLMIYVVYMTGVGEFAFDRVLQNDTWVHIGRVCQLPMVSDKITSPKYR